MAEISPLHRVLTLIASTLGLAPGSFDTSLRMEECREWDSLHHIELISAIEREFGLSLSFEQIVKMRSIEAILEVLSRP